MSNQSLLSGVANVVVEHNGTIIFDQSQVASQCTKISDIKKAIERKSHFPLGC